MQYALPVALATELPHFTEVSGEIMDIDDVMFGICASDGKDRVEETRAICGVANTEPMCGVGGTRKTIKKPKPLTGDRLFWSKRLPLQIWAKDEKEMKMQVATCFQNFVRTLDEVKLAEKEGEQYDEVRVWAAQCIGIDIGAPSAEPRLLQ